MNQDGDAANGEDGQDSFTATITVAEQPDLVVSTVSAPTDLVVGNPAQVDVLWTVRNDGSVATASGQWTDRVIFSRDAIVGNADDVTVGEFAHSGDLAAGADYSENRTVTLPANLVGNFFVFVRTDALGQVPEQNEANNNSTLAPISVTRPFADLVVEAVVAPAAALSGDPITVSWRVRNQGVATTDSSLWTDRVVLSADDILDSDDATLGQLAHSGTLAVDGTYSASGDFLLPDGISGDFHVFIVTDSGSNVFEFQFEGNNTGRTSTPVTVTEKPAPDLQPTLVTGPASGQPGETVQVTWTVANNGAGIAPAPWVDRVYLSSDGTLVGARPLASVPHTADLAASQSYTTSASVVIPTVADGQYRFVVVTDDGGAVFEKNFDDNNLLASTELAIGHPDLIPSILGAPSSATATETISFSWSITN